MKVAVVLHTDNPGSAHRAGEIGTYLAAWRSAFTVVELWLCYTHTLPEMMPAMETGVSHVRAIEVQGRNVPEAYLQALAPIARRQKIDLLLFGSDDLGAELATRLAYRLKGSACVQVSSCDFAGDRPQAIKPAYGNHLTARFVLERSPYCLSVAQQPCHPAELIPCEPLAPEPAAAPAPACDWIKAFTVTPEKTNRGLADAEIVLVVGQGVRDQQAMERLKEIAASIGAELGASRPVVMKAWSEMHRLVGASGQILAPKLCIAAGVSGTAVFSAGIENSELIVAINNDPNAAIFDIADVGIVGDLHQVLPELAKIMTANRNKHQ